MTPAAPEAPAGRPLLQVDGLVQKTLQARAVAP